MLFVISVIALFYAFSDSPAVDIHFPDISKTFPRTPEEAAAIKIQRAARKRLNLFHDALKPFMDVALDPMLYNKKVLHLLQEDLALKDSKFNFGEFIGEGSYGSVYHLTLNPYKGRKWVLKVGKSKPLTDEEALMQAKYYQESPDLVPAVFPSTFVFKDKKVLLMEDVGPSFDKIISNNNLDDKTKHRIVQQTTDALQLFLNKKLLHFDIKPANMLFDEKTKTAKFIDFGLSEDLNLPRKYRPFKYGTPLFTKNPNVDISKCRESKKELDFFALELSLFQMCAGISVDEWFNVAPVEEKDRIVEKLQEIIGDKCKDSDPDLFELIVKATSVDEVCPMDYFRNQLSIATANDLTISLAQETESTRLNGKVPDSDVNLIDSTYSTESSKYIASSYEDAKSSFDSTDESGEFFHSVIQSYPKMQEQHLIHKDPMPFVTKQFQSQTAREPKAHDRNANETSYSEKVSTYMQTITWVSFSTSIVSLIISIYAVFQRSEKKESELKQRLINP